MSTHPNPPRVAVVVYDYFKKTWNKGMCLHFKVGIDYKI